MPRITRRYQSGLHLTRKANSTYCVSLHCHNRVEGSKYTWGAEPLSSIVLLPACFRGRSSEQFSGIPSRYGRFFGTLGFLQASLYIFQNEKQRLEIAQLKAINQEHLRRKEALHRAELEKRQRIEWRAHQEQVSYTIPLHDLFHFIPKLRELNEVKRNISTKDKELALLTERLRIKEIEQDKLENEVKRLKSAESWRSISPTDSMDDLTSVMLVF